MGGGSTGAPRLPVSAEDKQASKSTEEPAEAVAKPVHHHKEGEMQVEPEVLLKKGGKYSSNYAPDGSTDTIIDEDDETEEADKDTYHKSSKKVGAAGRQSRQCCWFWIGVPLLDVLNVLPVQLPAGDDRTLHHLGQFYYLCACSS